MNSPDRNAKMERRRLFHGLCPRCGIPWNGPTRECTTCLRKRSEVARQRVDKRLAAGLCRDCGQRPLMRGYQRCKACNDQSNKRLAAYARRKAETPGKR